MKALVAIHDVMPETLDRVAALLARLQAAGHPRATLLVVPGRAWTAADIAQLQAWEAAGHELAAHGWAHAARHVRGVRHRLHAALLSRGVAEHLALDAAGIAALMRASAAWFPRHGLTTPTSYVPPAWALGALSHSQLPTLGFRRIEVLSGFLDGRTGHCHRLPLAGFEADTPARALAVRAANAGNAAWAHASGRPVRVGLHPYDGELRLADQLDRWLAGCAPGLRYSDWLPDNTGGAAG